MFKTQFSKSERVPTNPGSKFLDDYSPIVDKHGHTLLKKVGKKNIFELIQMDKDTVDVNLIIKRFQAGDEKALDVVKGFYADCTDFPKNYAEMLQGKIDCDNLFMKLSPEIRSQFENNPDVFWSNFGSSRWCHILGLENRDVQDSSVSDVLDSMPDVVDDVVDKGGVE